MDDASDFQTKYTRKSQIPSHIVRKSRILAPRRTQPEFPIVKSNFGQGTYRGYHHNPAPFPHVRFPILPPPSTTTAASTSVTTSSTVVSGTAGTDSKNDVSTTQTSATEDNPNSESASNAMAPRKTLKRTSLLLAFVIITALSATGATFAIHFINTFGVPPTSSSSTAFMNCTFTLIALVIATPIGGIILKYRIANLLIGFIYMFLLVVCVVFPAKSIVTALESMAVDTDTTIQHFASSSTDDQELNKFWASAQTKHKCCGTKEIDRVEDWPTILNTNNLPPSCCTEDYIKELKKRHKADHLPDSDPLVKKIRKSCALGLGRTRTRGSQFRPYYIFNRIHSGFYMSLTEAEVKRFGERFGKDNDVITNPQDFLVNQWDNINKKIIKMPATDSFRQTWKIFYLDQICNTVDFRYELEKASSENPTRKGVGPHNENGYRACAIRPKVFECDMCYPGDWSINNTAETIGWIQDTTRTSYERCLNEGAGVIQKIKYYTTTTTTTTKRPPSPPPSPRPPPPTTRRTTRSPTFPPSPPTTRRTTTRPPPPPPTRRTTTRRPPPPRTTQKSKKHLAQEYKDSQDPDCWKFLKPDYYSWRCKKVRQKYDLIRYSRRRRRPVATGRLVGIEDPNKNPSKSNETAEELCSTKYPTSRLNATVVGRELLLVLDYLTSYIYEMGEKWKSSSSKEAVPTTVKKGTWILWPIPTKFHAGERHPFKLAANLNRIPDVHNEKEAHRLAKKMYYTSRGIAENFLLKDIIHEKPCELVDENYRPNILQKLAHDLNRRFRLWGPQSLQMNPYEGLGSWFLSFVHYIDWICIIVSSCCIFCIIVLAVIFWQYYSQIKAEEYANLAMPKEFDVLHIRRDSFENEEEQDAARNRNKERNQIQRRLFGKLIRRNKVAPSY